MSALTLTVPPDFDNERESNMMKLAGTAFFFQRGIDGEGYWFTTERIGNTPANSMVPLMLQGDLTALAKSKGLSERHNFARHIPKPEKPKRTPRGPRKPKAPENPLFGAFNPFASK